MLVQIYDYYLTVSYPKIHFKSHTAEEDFHLQPLPQLLDIDDHQAGSRSTLGGFFKPKFNRDYPRNNVHRTSERHHKEVIDCGTNRQRGSVHTIAGDSNLHRDSNSLLHRLDPGSSSGGRDSSTLGKLPRTQYPASADLAGGSSNHRGHNKHDYRYNNSREGSHSPVISHNKYLPKKRRSSRGYSPTRLSRRSSRVEDSTAFNGE